MVAYYFLLYFLFCTPLLGIGRGRPGRDFLRLPPLPPGVPASRAGGILRDALRLRGLVSVGWRRPRPPGARASLFPRERARLGRAGGSVLCRGFDFWRGF